MLMSFKVKAVEQNNKLSTKVNDRRLSDSSNICRYIIPLTIVKILVFQYFFYNLQIYLFCSYYKCTDLLTTFINLK
jgi:hypothetical protein